MSDYSDLTEKARSLFQEFAMKFLPMVDCTLAARAREANPPSSPESLHEKLMAGRRIIMAEVLKHYCNEEHHEETP